MPKMRKKQRTMEYYIIYYPPTNSYFVNKSKKPVQSVRHKFTRAYNPNRPDYETEPLFQDIREYGEEAFVIRYSLEMPEWAECRAHYVRNTEPNDEVYKQVKAMRKESVNALPPKGVKTKHKEQAPNVK